MKKLIFRAVQTTQGKPYKEEKLKTKQRVQGLEENFDSLKVRVPFLTYTLFPHNFFLFSLSSRVTKTPIIE